MTTDQSIQLAGFWTTLADLQAKINNELIPVGIHLGIGDAELMIALETLSECIKTHFDRHTLEAVPRTV